MVRAFCKTGSASCSWRRWHFARRYREFCKRLVRLWVVLCVCSVMYGEEPWGTDASLARKAVAPPAAVSFSPCLYLIKFHQQVLSEADGPRSHFLPSSSEYTRRAMLSWGAAMGFVLGCDRLLRENNDPWVYRKTKLRCGYLKWNPVPKAPERVIETLSATNGGLQDRKGSRFPFPDAQ